MPCAVLPAVAPGCMSRTAHSCSLALRACPGLPCDVPSAGRALLASFSAAAPQAHRPTAGMVPRQGLRGMRGLADILGVKCSCALPRAAPLHRLPTRSLATHSVVTCSAKGKASVGSIKAMKLSKAKLTGVTVLDLSSGSECTAGSCSFLAAVECIPAGGKMCMADGSKNVGIGNR